MFFKSKVIRSCIIATISLGIFTWELPSQALPPPKREKKGAQRGSKVAEARSPLAALGVMALVPTKAGWISQYSREQLKDRELDYGLVTSDRISFWFYISPGCPEKIRNCSLRLEVLDHHQDWTWGQDLPWPEEGGFVAANMLQSAPALQVGHTYRWRLQVLDHEENVIPDLEISGDFERWEPSPELLQEVATAKDWREVYLAYEKHGAMFEMVDRLIRLYVQYPAYEPLQQDWLNLLPIMEMKCNRLPFQFAQPEKPNPLTCQKKKT